MNNSFEKGDKIEMHLVHKYVFPPSTNNKQLVRLNKVFIKNVSIRAAVFHFASNHVVFTRRQLKRNKQLDRMIYYKVAFKREETGGDYKSGIEQCGVRVTTPSEWAVKITP